MVFTTYILYSRKLNRFYTGSSAEFKERLEKHRSSRKTTEFTSKSDDWGAVLTISCNSMPQARAIEMHIKAMKSKIYISNLIKYPEMVKKLRLRFGNC